MAELPKDDPLASLAFLLEIGIRQLKERDEGLKQCQKSA